MTGVRTKTPARMANRGDVVFRGVVWFLVALIVILVVYPLVQMMVRVFGADDGGAGRLVGELVTASWMPGLLRDTFSVVIASSLAAVALATLFAWCNERTNASIGFLGEILPLLPFFLPPVAMAIGWVLLAAPDVGLLNAVASGVGWSPGTLNIFSFVGVVFVYSLFLVPYVYVIVAAGFRNMDSSLEEASLASGASMGRTLIRVSLPAIRPAIVGGLMLSAITGMWLFSIPVILAGGADLDILSVRIVRLLRGTFPPQYQEAILLSTIMLVTIAVIWLFYQRVIASGAFATVSGKVASTKPFDLGAWRHVVRVLMIGYLILTTVLPVLALLVVSLQPFWSGGLRIGTISSDNFDDLFGGSTTASQAMRNSLLLGAVAGLIGISVAALLSMQSRRLRRTPRRLLDAAAKLPAALSNIVLAVGFIIAFSGAPFWMAGTIGLLLLAYVIIYLPQASVAAGAASEQVDRQLMEASLVSGSSEIRTMRRVELPLMASGLVNGWALLFVLIVGDVAASSLLAGTNNPVIGFVITDIWEYGTYGLLAAISIVMCAATATVVALGLFISRRWNRRWR